MLRRWPDPILRQATNPVDPTDHVVLDLADRMLIVMQEMHGVGIAAPQVGSLSRVAIIVHEDTPILLINPQIISRSAQIETDLEGCLSLPGLHVPIPRAVSVTVRYVDQHGQSVEATFTDRAARIVQHEIDHLDGRLLPDHLDGQERRDALTILNFPGS